MTQFNILFIGMDVHKESFVILLADDDRNNQSESNWGKSRE